MGTIAALLADARRQARLSQRSLAVRADIPQASVSRIERGIIAPRATTIERWMTACGMSIELQPLRGVGVDRSVIRERLAMTPTERSRAGVQEALAAMRLQQGRLVRTPR